MLYLNKPYLLLGVIAVQLWGLELQKDQDNDEVLQKSRALLYRYEDPGQLLLLLLCLQQVSREGFTLIWVPA